MATTLLLVRHGATPNNLAVPAKLQGRRTDPGLAPIGIRQAESTAELLRGIPIHAAFASPLERAMQTAHIIAQPHDLAVQAVPELTECDVGRWDGLDWATIAQMDAEAHDRYHANPAEFGYPEGENFAQVFDRVAPALDELLDRHDGQTILAVSHHVVNRVYLAVALGLSVSQARKFSLDNCGVSVVVRSNGKNKVQVLNSSIHLFGIGEGAMASAA
ncbi:histidine phosphatase family protein [Tuwongella immobilis]|uniref:Uncharacterized protein n=1 Tax=Tuwongella immobilis TaxID=692036 RepID=A0A6C2YP26_9BACT|nr:histidine phosphatase family protein [Tuwongella immobilis]VIP02883.1 Phosphoglycerate mutase OS=Pirellula staleyi (strain ATCC 27377 / DSM 6068 / ICPB 4128) GN=Psta_4229 PE=4 SV=1: His_Phos_1 [Tuwongella immobilis]VTS02737.1 Phosphoglycerate mutase OS=Pirellula staleyi (strain ATCC 27377 / DSM 6068 / ICPB 4128) GN=Psta_4229 PE=4 SV=1: His_Phos_1 [Tuwongella immobilis]